ncbi:hypothetical protein EMIT0P218_230042 [Pseudomonas sp. IT-P218]
MTLIFTNKIKRSQPAAAPTGIALSGEMKKPRLCARERGFFASGEGFRLAARHQKR